MIQYYLCAECGKLYYLVGQVEIHINNHRRLAGKDWDKLQNRECQTEHLQAMHEKNHGGKAINARTKQIKEKRIKQKYS